MLSPLHIVVPDSNALFTQPSEDVVHKGFTNALNKLKANHSVELHVAAVVRSEIALQKIRLAEEQLKQARGALASACKFADLRLKIAATEKTLHEAIFAKFDHWLSSVSGKLIETPIAEINWQQTIECALWRKPPFDPPEKNNEKGFKDALLLETVCSIIRKNKDAKVWFLTKDGPLKQAFSERYPDHVVCADLEALKGHLIFIATQASDKYANQLVNAAQEGWDLSRADNLYQALNVEGTIRTEYAATLQSPELLRKRPFVVGRPVPMSFFQQPRCDLTPVGTATVQVTEVRPTGATSTKFSWCTTLKYIQLYEPVGGTILSMGAGAQDLTLVLDVHWDSKVTSAPAIVEPILESVVLRSKSLDSPQAFIEYVKQLLSASLTKDGLDSSSNSSSASE